MKRKNKKILDVREGESRVFINLRHKGDELNIGFPKKGEDREDVYIRVNGEEQERASIAEAAGYLNAGVRKTLSGKVKGLGRSLPKSPRQLTSAQARAGTCNNCGKKLRGNTAKPLCYECWSNR